MSDHIKQIKLPNNEVYEIEASALSEEKQQELDAKYLSKSGGELTGILYTSASTPLLIGRNGKVGMRAATSDKNNVGQINISNAWYESGNQWGAQISAYNGETGKHNEFRVSHNGMEYNAEDGTVHAVLHDGNVENYADKKGTAETLTALALSAANGYTDEQIPLQTAEIRQTLTEVKDDVDTFFKDADLSANAKKTLKALQDEILADDTGAANMAASIKSLSDNKYGPDNPPPVDTALDANSTNPVQNKAVKAALDGKVQKVSGKGLSTNDYTTAEKEKLAGLTKITVDSALSSSSTNPVQNKVVKAALDKKMGDFSIEIYNGTSGNPKPVRFASFNYSTCISEEGIAAKISLVSGHGNGTSYAFLEDAIFRVNYLGQVSVDTFKYYGTDAGTYDGAKRQYGDIFWLHDTTNKIIDFYVLMGQYARVNQTPWKRLTYSFKGTVTQHTSCTVYSSGEKTWANNAELATKNDIPEGQDLSQYATKTDLNNAIASAITTALNTSV